MKKLLLKLVVFVLIGLSIISIILMKFGGNVDYFYEKFTSSPAKSMIIGDSRSFQGIQPSIMDKSLRETNLQTPVLNYSFTIAQALSGPLYNKSIFKKLDPKTQNGVFIISVNPEFVSSDPNMNHSLGEFREAGQPPHNMHFVNSNPNFEYFFKNIEFFHFRGAFRGASKTHKNGWLEETNLPKDTSVFSQWKKIQMDIFDRNSKRYALSSYRIKSLDTLIKRLKRHGEVAVIRMPMSDDFYTMENNAFPAFHFKMDSLTGANDIKYYDFNIDSIDRYQTYDGHHLNKYSGADFTRALSDSIIRQLRNN